MTDSTPVPFSFPRVRGEPSRYSTEKQRGVPMQPSLPKCGFLGPCDPDEDESKSLPVDWTGDPFTYLPDRYVLTDEERDLANRYRNNDLSGGYFRSQIACFRAPKPDAQHERRRMHLASIRSQIEPIGFSLPASFQLLADRDDYVDRLRHNNIWFDIFPTMFDFPCSPECKLIQAFREGHSGDQWSLLLIPDGSHFVIYHAETLDIDGNYPNGGWKPDIQEFAFFECARSFDEWLTVYFLDCIRSDAHYAEMLKRYPGM